jgi:hypothetical protein
MTKNPALVVCDFKAGSYARYLGRVLTDKFEFELPLSAHWIEEIRNDPGQFQNEAVHTAVAPGRPEPDPRGGAAA